MISQVNDLHFLDGMVSRALSLLGFALLFAPFFWQYAIGHARLPFRIRRNLIVSGLVLELIGTGIGLNSVILNALREPIGTIHLDQPELTLLWHGILPILTATYYGRTWLGCISATVVASALFSHRWRDGLLAIPFCLLAFLYWTRLGHAAEAAWFSLPYLAQLAHNALICLWLAGLVLLALGRLSAFFEVSPSHLRRFSRFAVSAVPAAFLFGALRLADLYRNSGEDWLNSIYGRFFLIKLILVISILFIAARLRSRLRPRSQSQSLPQSGSRLRSQSHSFDGILTVEILLAAILLFLSALLSQLPLPASTLSENSLDPAPPLPSHDGSRQNKDASIHRCMATAPA